jgi:hypothetical protein
MRTREVQTQVPVRFQVIVLMILQRQRHPCNLAWDQRKKGVVAMHQSPPRSRIVCLDYRRTILALVVHGNLERNRTLGWCVPTRSSAIICDHPLHQRDFVFVFMDDPIDIEDGIL